LSFDFADFIVPETRRVWNITRSSPIWCIRARPVFIRSTYL